MDLKKRIIMNHTAHIERQKALRAYAEGRADYADHDRAKLDKIIRDTRRAIIDELSNAEVDALKAAGLDPEHALRILETKPASISPEMRKSIGLDKLNRLDRLKEKASAEYRADLAARCFFLVDKGFAEPFTPGRSIKDTQGDTIRKFETASTKQQTIVSVSSEVGLLRKASEAVLRHRDQP